MCIRDRNSIGGVINVPGQALGLALITVANDSLATPALLILALIGFGIAFWDFQQQTELKGAAVSDGGDFEDGI